MTGEMARGLADGGNGRTANRLSLPDQMRSVAWLQENREYAAEHSQAVVATTLGGFLGRIVTVGNLGTCARAAKVRLHGYADSADMARQVHSLEDRVEEHRKLLEKLSLAVARLEVGSGKAVAP